jgi:group I intron endonuclease
MIEIYKWTSKTTGLSYIGKTSIGALVRFKGHVFAAQNSPINQFHVALNKFGVDDFSLEILAEVETTVEANTTEIFYISFFDSYRNGYNMTKGGDGGTTEEAIKKMVKTRTTPGKDGITSYKSGGQKTLNTKQNRILDDGRTLLQATVDKTAKTRRERGDFEELSKNLSGTILGGNRICIYCNFESGLGNIKRWHDENCLKNPNKPIEEILQIRKESHRIKNPVYVRCPHCLKEVMSGNFKHHHGDKCKFKKDQE